MLEPQDLTATIFHCLGYAPEMMRGMLASPKGAEMLQQGLRELGMHLVRQLVK